MSERAWLSKRLESGKILCQACAQACKLDEGEYGICGVRRVEEGELRLLVYGLAAAVNVDPVEKKPMFHFLPKSRAFSVGTVGCNFSCKFCQNYDISQYPKEHEHKIIGHELPPESIVKLALENGCDSIAYTYNEPVVFFEYTYDTAKLAHERGLKNIYVTSGFETHKAIDLLEPYIDGMNIDIKSFSDEFYKEICGARLEPVLECVRYAHKKGIWVEITTLLIPGKNDSDDEIRSIAKFLANIDTSIPWHLSAFHPTYKMLEPPRTPESTLLRAYNIGQEEGLKYLYIGNVDNEDYESTYCPKCNKRVIDRSGNIGQFVTNELNENGSCPKCGYKLDGIWS
ncbi:AmmeMemoRadiSam system radical SAM enzyme [Candidatus Sulfurimonas baltica]|uniref:AmmeMemoRadiSam system radical SAM enzyme n=1 Tax=Candidatus Sulfurimonas baltica TaxID=2740404 RepID=A0A7S7LVB4_9BACT|nr:AmmeMemoRadiSam system radical SAM enzyme [Candidatus Sulfurimonas baltica]QOY51955.1 AmmeMemoRadiSam system radical SAM enzyme [Candidatus Sulfurimonas baltica]